MHQGNIGIAGRLPARRRRGASRRHGRLDILVNNAGITVDKTVLKMSDEDWHKVLDVNLSGAFYMSQAVLEHMVERGTRPDREHLVDDRPDRQHRPGELRGVEVGAVRPDEDARARRPHSSSKKAGEARGRRRRRSRSTRSRPASSRPTCSRRPREGARRNRAQVPVRPARPARRGRPRGVLPRAATSPGYITGRCSRSTAAWTCSSPRLRAPRLRPRRDADPRVEHVGSLGGHARPG